MTSRPDPSQFFRLLEVVLRRGGNVVAIYEGYFDESGDFDDPSKIFCISGYFIEADQAREMTQAWVAVLSEYGLPYFHMVDCAHGDDPFDRLEKHQRVDVEKKLIALIKRYTMKGFSAVAHADYFQPSESADIYGVCADMCARTLLHVLELNGMHGDIAYFFEAGHNSESVAYKMLANKLKEMNASVIFAKKQAIPLLQAADLLAWQTSKYVKDKLSKARPPRADFLSLMEHNHDFCFLTHQGNNKSISWESWPLNRRSAKPAHLTLHTNRQIPYFVENDDGNPVFPVQEAIGWRQGGGNMAFIGYKNLLDKEPFVVSFDERALQMSALAHINAMKNYVPSENITRFLPVLREAIDEIEKLNQKPKLSQGD